MLRFIAELGQNHNGSLKTAKQMVDDLKGSGAWAIKSAKRNVELHKEEWSTIENYRDGMNYYEHRKDLELTKDEYQELKEYVEANGFVFMSSFTDLDSLNFLKEIGTEWFKIASSRNVDTELIRHLYGYDNVIISDGMSSGMRVRNLAAANNWICLLCTSSYPTLVDEVYYESGYQGFSAHWQAYILRHLDHALYALLQKDNNVVYVERHITKAVWQNGVDHTISLQTDDVEDYIKELNNISKVVNTNNQIFPGEKHAIKKLRHDL